MMLTIIVIAITPSSSSVVAAFLLFGLRKAGTPLEIASTPVSAAQPDENARASRKISADRGERFLEPGLRDDQQVGALDVGQVAGEQPEQPVGAHPEDARP